MKAKHPVHPIREVVSPPVAAGADRAPKFACGDDFAAGSCKDRVVIDFPAGRLTV